MRNHNEDGNVILIVVIIALIGVYMIKSDKLPRCHSASQGTNTGCQR